MNTTLMLSRRSLLKGAAHSLSAAEILTAARPDQLFVQTNPDRSTGACDGGVLGQGVLRYSANRH